MPKVPVKVISSFFANFLALLSSKITKVLSISKDKAIHLPLLYRLEIQI